MISSYTGESAKLWRRVAEPFATETGITTEIFESPLPSASVINARDLPQFSAAIVAAYQIPNLENFIEKLSPDDVQSQRQLTPELEELLGGSPDDAMARNYAPDWHAVGKANPERSRLVEEIIEKVR